MPTCCQACKPHSVYMAIATVLNILVHTLIFFSQLYIPSRYYILVRHMVCTNCLKKKKKNFLGGLVIYLPPLTHACFALLSSPTLFLPASSSFGLAVLCHTSQMPTFFFLDKRGRGPRVACRLMLVPPIHFFFSRFQRATIDASRAVAPLGFLWKFNPLWHFWHMLL